MASPNHLHVPQLRQIAATRPLPLLIEKPLYTDPDDAGFVDKMLRDYPAPVWVAMEYRYMPPIARLLAEVDHATGGVKMLTIREHRFPFLPKVGDWNRFNRNTGGTLVEKCCHFFDLMRLVMRAEPVRVMASAAQMLNHLDESYDGATPDIWDAGYVIVDFEGGARAMLELCMFAEGARYQEEISAVGPSGKIEAFVPGPGRFWDSDQPAPVPQIVFSPRKPKGPHVSGTARRGGLAGGGRSQRRDLLPASAVLRGGARRRRARGDACATGPGRWRLGWRHSSRRGPGRPFRFSRAARCGECRCEKRRCRG